MIWVRCKVQLHRLWRSRRASVVTYFAVALPVLIGAVGMSVDVADWHVNRRVAQSTADASAVAGALELVRSGSSGVDTAATIGAEKNGYGGTSGESLTINYPPASGSYAGDGDAVEVIYSRTVRTLFSRLFFKDSTVIKARAVARARIDDTCVWSLDPTVTSALKFSGGGTASYDCGIMANSSDPSAITQTGGGCVTATNVRVVGGYSGSCIQPTPLTGIKPVEDPFATLEFPSYSGCDYTNNFTANSGETLVLQPGVYCGNISAVSTGQIQFEPGNYILDNVSMNFGGQSVVTGLGGTTFFMTQPTSGSATIGVQAGATVNLTAPTTGPYAGILFYEDRNAPKSITNSLTGGATMNLDGIIYMPDQNLKFSGGSATDNSSSILIADTIEFTGQSYLGNFDGSAAKANPGLIRVSLVE